MNKFKGVILIMISAMIFGTIPLLAKMAYQNGFNPFTFTLFRFIFGIIMIPLILIGKKIPFTIERKHYSTIFKISLFGYSIMMLTYVMSYNYIPTGLATTLHFIYPVAVMLGSIIFFKERVAAGKILALLVAFIGIYLIAGFHSAIKLNITGIILALISGLSYAYYILIMANSNLKFLNPYIITFYISIFNTIILSFISFFSGNLDLNFTIYGLFFTMLAALFCNMVAMVFFQLGLREVDATSATILSTLEPITSLVIGFLLLKEVLSWHHLSGVLMIICAVIIVALLHKKKKEKSLTKRRKYSGRQV